MQNTGNERNGEIRTQELLELLDRTPAPELEPIELMDPQSIMAELELRGGDFDGSKGTFLRDDTGAVTHLRMSRLLIKES